jgi:SCY1-like protein 1
MVRLTGNLLSSFQVRHPNVLSFLHSTESEVTENGVTKAIIYVVTEPVTPLSEKIKELGLSGVQR